MRHWIAGLVAVVMLVSVVQVEGALFRLDFDSGVPGTIEDKDGIGTGFTHRLPGTGSSLPAHDPNMDFSSHSGFLTITSTQANQSLTERLNPGGLEAFGFHLPDVGNGDLSISAKFNNINVAAWSDQLMLYAGTSIDQNVHAGFHQGNNSDPQLNRAMAWEFYDGSTSTPVYVAAGTDHVEWQNDWKSAGYIGPANGDDAVFTLARTAGKWWMAWDILTESTYYDGYTKSGSFEGTKWAVPFPGVQAGDDMYVGILYSNPRTSTTQTSQVDWFQVEYSNQTVPEPSSVITFVGLLGMGLIGHLWRRRKGARSLKHV